MESALFRQRARAMHTQTAARRQEELEIKVRAAEKGLAEKKQKTSKGLWGFLLASFRRPFRYSKFSQADKLWESSDDEDGDGQC